MQSKNWNKYWGKSDELDFWRIPSNEVIEFINENKPSGNKLVLDLGCGLGRHSVAFAENGFSIIAVDFSEQALTELENISKNNNFDIKTIVADYNDTIFEESMFDIILSYNVLYHGYKEEFKNGIDKCKKYLKTNGNFMFTCPTREDGKYGSGTKIADHTYASENSVHPGDIHYFSSQNDIEKMLIGFKILSINKYEHYWDNNDIKVFSSYWIVKAKKL